MQLVRNPNGTWIAKTTKREVGPDAGQVNPVYVEALPRYMTAFDLAFSRAKDKCEFEFILCLLRVRGLQDAGWDPYETTRDAIPAFVKLHRRIREFETARHLQLWTYGHIVEASEPYELLANLIKVSQGGRFTAWYFPSSNRRPPSPEWKIKQIAVAAAGAGMPDVVTPLKECWNRDLRNSIFHADYSLHGGEVRTNRPPRIYSHEEIMGLVNRSIACHEALAAVYKAYVGFYIAPEMIPVHPEFSPDSALTATIIVRSGYGVIGMKDSWSPEQIRSGNIPFRVGHFTQEEIRRLDTDPTNALLPPLPRNKRRGYLLPNLVERLKEKLISFWSNRKA